MSFIYFLFFLFSLSATLWVRPNVQFSAILFSFIWRLVCKPRSSCIPVYIYYFCHCWCQREVWFTWSDWTECLRGLRCLLGTGCDVKATVNAIVKSLLGLLLVVGEEKASATTRPILEDKSVFLIGSFFSPLTCGLPSPFHLVSHYCFLIALHSTLHVPA